MDRRFFNIFPGLTEEKAIEILKTPLDQLEDGSERYIAASHLINFPTEESVNALIETVADRNPDQSHHIARRKAIESLGRLQAKNALPILRSCLGEDDGYLVENAVWAIGEIGADDEALKEEIAQLLDRDGQSYRVIIQTLVKFDYQPALERIRKLVDSEDEMIASAAIIGIYRLSEDGTQMGRVVEFLQHSKVRVRRGAIQDLVDAQYYPAIPEISRCPVSIAFRLRGIRLLGYAGIPSGNLSFEAIEPALDRVVRDDPRDLEFVHEYDQPPSLEFVIGELYHTDFGRCYLACKTLLDWDREVAGQALLETYRREAHDDYGAHYHVIKLLGWLKYMPGRDLILEALSNSTPQFQKSRAAAAIALGNFGDRGVIPLLEEQIKTQIFDLKYACLLSLEQLGAKQSLQLAIDDSDLLIQAKARRV